MSLLPSNTTLRRFKVVFLGDIGVGKTSLITRFIYGTFDPTYQTTIGIDFLCKTVTSGDQTVRLQLWDTAGQERYRSLIPNYIRDSCMAVIIIDLTDQESFKHIDSWIDTVKNHRPEDTPILLVGNKNDLTDERVVAATALDSVAKKHGLFCIETSAKTGKNVDKLFQEVGRLLAVNNLGVREEDPVELRSETEDPVKCRC